jgi:hypothetical protein
MSARIRLSTVRGSACPGKPLLGVLMAIVCALTVGCSGDSSAPAFPDEEVLRALDCYGPIYKVDANGRVVNLRLDGKLVTGAMLAEIGKLTELRQLSLYAAPLTDESLARLQNLPQLRSLGLGGTPITDKGLVHLEKLESLQWLWLPRAVSPKAIEKLKSVRPGLNVYLQ